MEISKSDWKLFRARIAEWQEDYMERLVKEYIEVLNLIKGRKGDQSEFLLKVIYEYSRSWRQRSY